MNVWNGFENFFYVSKIELVLFVTEKLTSKRMENRKNHGLVYYEKPYGKLTFGNKIIEPQAGQIVYFPQGSSYDVSVENAAESDGCIAVNFLAPDRSCSRRNLRKFFRRYFRARKRHGKKNAPPTKKNALKFSMPCLPR